MVIPPVYPCSSRSRSKIRFEVCCCLAGRPLSSSRIRSMIPTNGSSFGRAGGRLRRYPGGTENASIFATVRGSIPNRRAASRRLIPSTYTARRTCPYSSTPFIPPPSAHLGRRPSHAGLLLRPCRPIRPLYEGLSLRRSQLTYRWKGFTALLRIFHQSSHLGDEFLLANPLVHRVNLSYEEPNLILSQEFGESSTWLRIYGGAGYLIDRDPSSLKPWTTQAGVELTSPWRFLGDAVRPLAAV